MRPAARFYDNSILSGTKILRDDYFKEVMFYDNSILSGTKIRRIHNTFLMMFYDNSILSGTKMFWETSIHFFSFTITQFFQVLK